MCVCSEYVAWNFQELSAITALTFGHSRNTSVARVNEEYILQVSKEIEGRLSNELSHDLSRTESRISGALPKLEEILLNTQVLKRCGTIPGTVPNIDMGNQEPIEDRSHDHPHPDLGPSVYQYRHSIDSDPDETPQSYFTFPSKISTRTPCIGFPHSYQLQKFVWCFWIVKTYQSFPELSRFFLLSTQSALGKE